MSGLSNHALLMSLNISQWSARKLDRNETAAVAVKHGTNQSVARVNKSLLPMAHSLDRIHKLTGAIRTEFYKLTLPWGEGQGILKADAYLTVAPRFAALKNDWYSAVNAFLADYPTLRDDAKIFLNSLYREEDYPEVSHLQHKFRMDISFGILPSPEDCRKVGSLAGFADVIAQDMASQYTQREKGAMDEAWQRLYETVSRAQERLADPKAIFRNSLIDNARELCSILPSLNISDDPNLEAMRQSLEKSLCQYEPDMLRDSPYLRSQVANKMEDIMDKMAAFYG